MHTGRCRTSDLGLMVLLVSGGLVGTAGAATNQGQTAPTTAYVLVLAAGLPIAISTWRPAWAAGLTGAATAAYVGLGYAYGPILFALVVAVYRLAAAAPVRRVVIGTAALICAGLGAVAASAATTGVAQGWSDFVAAAAFVAVPAVVGVAVKARRDATAELRDEQSRRAISEERLRLAQEVHDEVGHGLAVIAMQSGVALRMLDRDPAKLRRALEAIRAASTNALDGVRAELAALQGTEASRSPLQPATGLAEVPALTGRLRSSGLPVALEIDDIVTGLDLPTEIDRAAYRIVQESLTNVLRHGGPGATAQVRVEADAGTLRLEITDTGCGAPPGANGHGIKGMRARAEGLGGCMAAESGPDGGFVVRAWLPIPDRVSTPGRRT